MEQFAMSPLVERLVNYTKRTRMATAVAASDDYRRGYLEGLRHHYRVDQLGASDEHLRWLVFPDSPEYAEFERGYCDGLVGSEPQS
jgi:hypothetical protein